MIFIPGYFSRRWFDSSFTQKKTLDHSKRKTEIRSTDIYIWLVVYGVSYSMVIKWGQDPVQGRITWSPNKTMLFQVSLSRASGRVQQCMSFEFLESQVLGAFEGMDSKWFSRSTRVPGRTDVRTPSTLVRGWRVTGVRVRNL